MTLEGGRSRLLDESFSPEPRPLANFIVLYRKRRESSHSVFHETPLVNSVPFDKKILAFKESSWASFSSLYPLEIYNVHEQIKVSLRSPIVKKLCLNSICPKHS